jgi:hypothetical protein
MYEQHIRVNNTSIPNLAELTGTLVKMAVFCSFYMEWDEIGGVVKQQVS